MKEEGRNLYARKEKKKTQKLKLKELKLLAGNIFQYKKKVYFSSHKNQISILEEYFKNKFLFGYYFRFILDAWHRKVNSEYEANSKTCKGM